MMLFEACEWLKATRLSLLLRESKWGFALIEMMHLLALALLGGALLILGLRIFGVILKSQALAGTVRDLGRIITLSLLAMLISGFLLFTEGPLRYYGNGAFRVKLLLIAAAVVSAIGIHRFAQDHATLTVAPNRLKIVAALSFTFWLGAAVAGRLIGVL
jgi:hypothetical protein